MDDSHTVSICKICFPAAYGVIWLTHTHTHTFGCYPVSFFLVLSTKSKCQSVYTVCMENMGN